MRAPPESEDSDEDVEDGDLPPVTVSASTAVSYIASLKQFVGSKDLGEEHMAAIERLENTAIGCALKKPMHVTGFLRNKHCSELTFSQ